MPYAGQMLNPKILVRVAGLPFSVLHVLRDQHQFFAIAEEIQHLQQKIDTWKPLLDEQLYRYIQRNQDRPDIHDVIRIKRDVYNNRIPKHVMVMDRIADHDRPLYDLLWDWYSALIKVSSLQERAFKEMQGTELHFHRRLMETALKQEGFMKTMPLASPSTYEALKRFEVTAGDSIGSRGRKLQLGLLKYLTRATCKTSPFGYFGMVGVGRLGEEAVMPTKWLPPHTHSKINRSLMQALSEPFNDRYVVNPNVWLQGEDLLILKREHGFLPQVMYRSGESLIRVTLDAALQFLFDEPSRRRVWSAQELRQWFFDHFDGMHEEDYVELVTSLLEVQVLLPYEVWRLDHLEQESSHEALDLIRRLAADYGQQSAESRQQRIGTIQQQVRLLRNAQTEAAKLVPLYDDSVLQEEIVFEREQLRGLLLDMAALHSVLEIWDPKLRERLILGEAFRQKFGEDGECDSFPDLIECLLTFKGEHADDFRYWDFNPFEDPDIELLETLRVQVLEHVKGQSHEHAMRIDRDVLRSVSEQIPQHLKNLPQSFTFFVQPDQAGGGVLNNILSGFGRCFARFAATSEHLQDLPHVLQQLQEDSPQAGAWTDLYASFGFNANLRPLLTESFIDYTGCSGSPDGIRLEEVVFFYDRPSRMIRIKTKDGAEIYPLHLGQMAVRYAPSAFQVLASLMHSDQLTLHLAEQLLTLREDTVQGAVDDVQMIPEIRMDRLVLSRQRWHIQAQALTDLVNTKSEWEAYLRVLEFFNKRALPLQFFMRPSPSSSPVDSSKIDDYFKPQYMDLTSYALFRLFKRNVLQLTGPLILEPIVPALPEVLRLDGDLRQVELGFEWYRREEA